MHHTAAEVACIRAWEAEGWRGVVKMDAVTAAAGGLAGFLLGGKSWQTILGGALIAGAAGSYAEFAYRGLVGILCNYYEE